MKSQRVTRLIRLHAALSKVLPNNLYENLISPDGDAGSEAQKQRLQVKLKKEKMMVSSAACDAALNVSVSLH